MTRVAEFASRSPNLARMLLRLALACALSPAFALAAFAAEPAPTPTPSPNADAERLFAKAREAWHTNGRVPYVRYGALVRYQNGRSVVDTWWDAWYRSADGAFALERLHDIAVENHRLGGVAFSIFGVKIFDTNPDAEAIRLDDPQIDPDSSFGVVSRLTLATPGPGASESPLPQSRGELRELGRVEANSRAYQIALVGTETVLGASAVHLTLTPLRDPNLNRLRDLWLDPTTYRTVQSRVHGIFNGKPYDGTDWTVRYVVLDGRNYVQQLVADGPLKFGLDTTIPKMEFDFVDYQFPAEAPPFTFDRTIHLKPS